MAVVIHEDDSNGLDALTSVTGIASSNLDLELERWRSGLRTPAQYLRIATHAAVVADLSRQLNAAMLKAVGEFVPASVLTGPN